MHEPKSTEFDHTKCCDRVYLVFASGVNWESLANQCRSKRAFSTLSSA